MKDQGATGRSIVLLVEGDTERAALAHLKRYLDGYAERIGRPRVRLKTSVFDGALSEREVRGRAEKLLCEPSVVGVIALTDLSPQYSSAAAARATICGWLPGDPRCQVHVAVHDFEAWLLLGWEAILKQAGIAGTRRPWGKHPEDINGHQPPAHRLHKLFQQGKPPRKYKKPIDGKKLFEQLDLDRVAASCPEFRKFLDCLLKLAGYTSST